MLENRVKSGNAKVPADGTMPIPSQAQIAVILCEGVETRKMSANNKSSHERPTTVDKTPRYVYRCPEGASMRNTWSHEEDQIVINEYVLRGVKKTADRLGRSPGSVAHRAIRLGVGGYGKLKPKIIVIDGYPWVCFGSYRAPIHRLVAEMSLETQLQPQDIVHHADGNVWNIAPDNLVVTDRAGHMRMHPKARDESGRFTTVDDIVRPLAKAKELMDKEP